MVRKACSLVILLGSLPSLGEAAERVDFNQQVRPILANNCFACHGPDERNRKGKLRLDLREEAVKTDRKIPAIAPGKPEESALVARITHVDVEERMPPPETKKSLAKEEIDTLRRWIAEGAEYAPHWAFLPLKDEAPPRQPGNWPASGIDAFVAARLAKAQITPSPEADRPTLIRRVYLDLIGLPPSPAEVAEFVGDHHRNAYERLVDRVLASPHHGERWGRHWLDQARYSDSDGYSIDSERPMWPYRDWVIRAINADQPFDQFTIDQIAGDLLPNPTRDQRVATAFHRNTLVNMEGGTDPEQFRNEAVADRVNTTGAVWLGLTVGCAQCHNHKYDPITHREYYQLFAFFNSTEDVNEHNPKLYLAKDEAEGAELERVDLEANATYKEVEEIKKQKDRSRLEATEGRLKELTKKRNAMMERIPSVLVLRELRDPRATHVHVRGDFLRHGERVSPGTPAFLPPIPEAKSRLDLAKWLVANDNPLTPRVMVNRVWMRYFGQGLVETENDFGAQGGLPTHPELLDWLGRQWMAHGWSPKWLHRHIVTSATYRQASRERADLRERDPLNKLLGRQNRIRLDAEILRDSALTASGLLARNIGGPSVRPPQPAGVYAFTQRAKTWTVSEGADHFRRGLYTFLYRSAPHPSLTTFDASNFQTTCTRRARTNTPLQALAMANDEAILEMAKALGEGVQGATDAARVEWAFRACLSRPPTARELERLAAFVREERQAGSSEARAWASLARVLFNLDEFVTRE